MTNQKKSISQVKNLVFLTPRIPNTETKMLASIWRHFCHWLYLKLSFWQLSVQPVMKISSKWQHFRFDVRPLEWLFLHLMRRWWWSCHICRCPSGLVGPHPWNCRGPSTALSASNIFCKRSWKGHSVGTCCYSVVSGRDMLNITWIISTSSLRRRLVMWSKPRGDLKSTWDVIALTHFPRYWPFVRGIHLSPVNSLTKG